MNIDRSRFDKYKVENAYNNNPHITGYRIPVHSEDWYAFRKTGFGASEISLVCGKANYGKVLPKLLEEKAGISEDNKKMNEAMFSGLLAEPIIAERWKYYDGTPLGYLDNYQNKNVMRNCREVEMYLVNDKYPWLFASIDRSILKDQGDLIGGRLTSEHPLELKQLSFFAAQKWENKVPPGYVYQIHQQMIVCDVEYCELAVLMDGYKFEVYPFSLDLEIAEEICTESYKQWQVVEKMKELYEAIEHYKGKNRWDRVNKLQADLDSLMPLPDSNEGWKEFLDSRYMQEKIEFEGKTTDYRMVRQRQKLMVAQKAIEEKVTLIDNRMRQRFVSEGGEYMHFGVSGKVRHYKQKNDKVHRLDYKGVKDRVEPTAIYEIVEPLFDGIQ